MNESRKLDLASTYLGTKILGAHTIRLELTETRLGHLEGHVRLDPNHCSLDLWGDKTGCTKMGIASHSAEATRMKTWDPHGHHRVHYILSIKGMDAARVHLIEYPTANLWYLTVEGEQGNSMVPLFPADWFEFDAAGTIQTRYGVPIRKILSRGDVEEMRAEAETVRRALAELDAQEPAGRHAQSVDRAHIDDVRAALAELEAKLHKLES